MAGNPLPAKLNELFTMLEDAADAAAAHATAVGLLQNTETKLRADLLATRTADETFQTGKVTKLALTTAQTVADSNGKAYLGKSRLVLSTFLGSDWSVTWSPTGFPNQSTAVPSTLVERQSLLGSLQSYFTANPTHENAPLGVTAAAAGTLFTALSDARSAVNQGITDQAQNKNLRDASETALRKRMKGLIEELTQLLDGSDPLWFAFGLVAPDGEDTPDQVSALILGSGDLGTLVAEWPDAPRAASYRVEIQIVGVDPDFHLVLTVHDSDCTLTGLPSGAQVRVRVIAVNSAGAAAPPSEVAEALVP